MAGAQQGSRISQVTPNPTSSAPPRNDEHRKKLPRSRTINQGPKQNPISRTFNPTSDEELKTIIGKMTEDGMDDDAILDKLSGDGVDMDAVLAALDDAGDNAEADAELDAKEASGELEVIGDDPGEEVDVVDATDGVDEDEEAIILEVINGLPEDKRASLLAKLGVSIGDSMEEAAEEPEVAVTQTEVSSPNNGNALAKLIGSLKF